MNIRQITHREIEQAIVWRAQGMKWREIGAAIAKLRGRPVPFRENTMQHVCRPFMEKELPSHD